MASKAGVVVGGVLITLGSSSVVGGLSLMVSAFIVGNETIVSSEKMATLLLSGIVTLLIGAIIALAGTAILDKNNEDQKETLKTRKNENSKEFAKAM